MKDKSKLTAIILAVLAILVVVISFVTKNVDENNGNDILIVENASNFYTVNSCLYRLVTYISSQDKDSLLLVLNDNYKSKNSVTKDNVMNLFTDIDITSTFVSEKMYYSLLSENITKYYVKGYIENSQIYDEEVLQNNNSESIYFIVYLDTEQNIFSIEPYDGKIFIEGDLDE